MAYETFEKVEGVIQGIDRGDDCCSMTVSLISDGNIVNVVVSGDTTVVDNVRLRPGMRIAALRYQSAYARCISSTVPRRACHIFKKRTAGAAGLF